MIDSNAEDASCPGHDGLEFVGLVVIQSGDQTEAVAQWPGDESGAGGGADKGEPRQIQTDRTSRRTFAQHDVELEVLHRGIKDLFDRATEAMDLVDEQDIALTEPGEERGEITRPFECRTGGDVQSHAELRSNDAGERGLSEARRTGEQQMIDSLLTPPCRLEDDAEVLLELTLTHELVEVPGAKSAFLADEVPAIRFER